MSVDVKRAPGSRRFPEGLSTAALILAVLGVATIIGGIVLWANSGVDVASTDSLGIPTTKTVGREPGWIAAGLVEGALFFAAAAALAALNAYLERLARGVDVVIERLAPPADPGSRDVSGAAVSE